MQKIDNISNDARQKHTILLDADSTPIVLELVYKPSQMGWFVDVIYDTLDFAVRGLRVTTNTNILNQWRNKLPFGLICQCNEAQDPLLIDDFIVGRAVLSVMTSEEVQGIVDLEKKMKADD
jgi:hypothetical protein